MLFRAHAYVLGSLDDSERTVFFECLDHDDAAPRLLQLLSLVWGLPQRLIEVYNIHGERELLEMAAGGGDARLFEVGWGPDGRIGYARRECTQLLVRPSRLPRLVQAQMDAESLAAAGYTVPRAAEAAA